MQRFILQRVGTFFVMLFAVSIVIFLLCRLLPGNILNLMFFDDPNATPALEHQEAVRLGLTGSYVTQYLHWAGQLVRLNLGRSLTDNVPVSQAVVQAIPITTELIVLGLLFATVVAVPLGIVASVMRGRLPDVGARVTALIGISVPNFWLATLFLIFTSRVFGWVPPLRYVKFTDDPAANLEQFILPAIAMSFFTMALVMRMLRTSTLEVMKLDYVRTARAKGLPRRRVLTRHVLRNALIPVITVLGYEIGYLISAAAVVEVIFDLPGLGSTLLTALNLRDYPTIEAIVMIIAAVFLFVNMCVDVLYGYLDPRISLAR